MRCVGWGSSIQSYEAGLWDGRSRWTDDKEAERSRVWLEDAENAGMLRRWEVKGRWTVELVAARAKGDGRGGRRQTREV